MEGGQAALAGFLYQFLGSGALAAMNSSLTVHKAEGDQSDTDISAIFGNIAATALKPEVFQQDAVLEWSGEAIPEGEERRSLIQFKYSADSNRSITDSELKEIASKLAVSEQEANEQHALPADYWLISNRTLNSVATQTLRDVDKKGRRGRPPNWLKSLRKLSVVKVAASDWLKTLDRFACRYGVLEVELEDGIPTLIGRLAITAGHESIDERWLKRVLFQDPELRSISPQDLLAKVQKGIKNHQGICQIPEKLIRRNKIVELIEGCRRSPIVGIRGDGGCGKTALIHQAFSELSRHDNGVPYIVCQPAEEVTSNWLCGIIGGWRGSQLPFGNQTEIAVSRLQRAQVGDSLPVLVCGIDGLDEAIAKVQTHSFSTTIGRHLRAAWEEFDPVLDQPPRWTIVLSFRNDRDLDSAWTGYHDQQVRNNIPMVDLEDFNDREIVEAADSIDPSVGSRIQAAVSNITGMDDFLADGMGENRHTAQPISKDLLITLRHPVMWGCFAALNPEIQRKIIDGDVMATGDLVSEFVQRFIYKLKRRRRDLQHLDVQGALKTISNHCVGKHQPYLRDAQWIDPVCTCHHWERNEANLLWREALSAGIVQIDQSDSWRWTHQIVPDWLTFQPVKVN